MQLPISAYHIRSALMRRITAPTSLQQPFVHHSTFLNQTAATIISHSAIRHASSNANAEESDASAATRGSQLLNELYMKALEPKPTPLPAIPPSELERGKALYSTYVKLMWKRNRVLSRDLNRKIRLKWAAIHALPTLELKRAALVVQPYVPLRLRLAAVTPPLKGFHLPSELETPSEIPTQTNTSSSTVTSLTDGTSGATKHASEETASPTATSAGDEKKAPAGSGNTSTLAAIAASRRRVTAGGSSGLLRVTRRDATGAAIPSAGIPSAVPSSKPTAIPSATTNNPSIPSKDKNK